LASPYLRQAARSRHATPADVLGLLAERRGWVAFLAVTHVGNYLYAVRAVQGISYTFYFVAAATLVADLSPPSRLGQALGWFGSAGC